MEEHKEKQMIQQAFDNALSDIQEDPWMARRVLNLAHKKGEIPVKKKLSVGFILVLAAVLITAAALALSLSQAYFEDVAKLQSSNGFYDDWSLETKQEMVGILQKHGLISEEEAASMTTEKAIDAWMIKRYGVDDRSDSISLWAVLETELGSIEGWSLEDKAWYSQMQIASGLQSVASDEAIYAVLDVQDIQPDEAISLAKKAIIDAFGLEENALEQHQVEIYFQSFPDDEFKEMHYDISFRGEAYEDFYSCSLTRDGKIMDHSMGEAYRSPAEQVLDKQQFLLENDLEASRLFTQYAQEHISGDYSFVFWPLEDKKAVTDMLRPIILENMEENPGYADQTRIFWANHLYGLPDENAIDQEQAIAIAKEQLMDAFGLTSEQTALVDKIGLFYEITDSQNPLWKITLRIGEQRDAAQAAGMDLSCCYRIVIHAYSGEVLETHSYTSINDNNPDDVALTN